MLARSMPCPLTSMALELAFASREKRRTNAQIFGELQELTIEEFSGPGQSVEQIQQVARAVNGIISVAGKLEVLSISEIGDQFFVLGPIYVSMSDLIPSHGLARIRDLTLRRVDLTRRQLADFCGRRSKTLVNVSFHNVNSKNSTWEDILDGLRTLQWPQLKQFRLDCCYDPETSTDDYDLLVDLRVEEYLLHKTDKNPRTDLEEDEA